MSMNGILKSPLLERRRLGLSVRFEDDTDVDIVNAVRAFVEGEDKVQYIRVLQKFATGDLKEDVLLVWVTQLRENVGILGKECEGILVTLLKQNWPRKDDKLVTAFESFIVNLLSAHTFYLRVVLRSIVDYFAPRHDQLANAEQRGAFTSAISDDDVAAFDNVHRVIKAIIKLVPLAPSTLIPMLADGFPYMKRDCQTQAYYVHHLLRVTDYLPMFRRNLLEVIVDRMTKLDVYSPKEEIQDAEMQLEEQQDLIGEMEINDRTDMVQTKCDGNDAESSAEVLIKNKMAHELANVLDVLMAVVFEFIKKVCHGTDGELEWEATKKLYRELLSVFDLLILPTYASCHVQFLLFYVCSFHPSIAAGFFDYLWKKVIDPNTPSILRQASVSYIGGFLARATFVPVSMIVNGFKVICNFLHRYIDSQDGCKRVYPDVGLHGPFFSTCQAVFYVFAFRHKELAEMSDGIAFLKSLNLTRIVSCCLNPLKFCLPVIVTNFAAVARNYQLVYCNTIIERNNRLALPTVSIHRQLTDFISDSLDSFFPFDPYLLVRSSEYIRPIYREYQSNLDEESDSDMEAESDEFLAEEETSCKINIDSAVVGSPLSILPDFVYGTSPGFKQSTKMSSPLYGSF